MLAVALAVAANAAQAQVGAIPENAASTRHVVLGHHDMGHVVWTLKNVGPATWRADAT